MTTTQKTWVDLAKAQKQMAVETTERGDITPTVIVEKDGKVMAIIVAPQVDKMLGLQAATMAQMGFNPDALTIIMDAHISNMDAKGKTAEEATAEFRKKYPKGMQAACDEEGACAAGEISDCLICHRIEKDGKIIMATLPYNYHGKNGGVPFSWKEIKGFKGEMVDDGKDEKHRMTGFIPDSLRKIMSAPSVLDEIPQLAVFKDFSPERARFHTARAMLGLLMSQHFMVLDFVTKEHPEWTSCKENGLEMIDKSIEAGFLPKESEAPCKAVVEAHMGKATFREEFAKLILDHLYWLPNEFRQTHKDKGDLANFFAEEFERFCMSPAPAMQEAIEASAKNQRVRVSSGDQSEDLGEGTYVGDVTVYFIQMPDGSLRSNDNAETRPDPKDVPEGGKVVSAGKNPKIVLDSGKTVYGCQVWWENI